MSYEFGLGHVNRSKFWAAQIQAATGKDWGQTQYKRDQVEPTRYTLKKYQSRGIVQKICRKICWDQRKIDRVVPDVMDALLAATAGTT